MSAEENKAIVRRFYEEVWGKRNLAVADELLDANVVLHTPRQSTANIVDREEYKQMVTYIYTAFPDLQATVEEMIAEGDKVVVRWAWQGTHQGEWQGVAATGKPIRTEGITIFRLANGRIVDDRFQANGLGLMQQIGASPVPGEG
jgi:steroid delta-isomerase-like uncharacterized protein